MRPLGHLLLWLGFFAGAFVSVLRLENADAKWSTIPWLWYVLAICVGVVGVWLLKTAQRNDHADDEKTEAEYSVVRSSLDSLSATVTRLSQQTEPSLSEVVGVIDDQCAESFSDFADARQSLVKRFGLKVYADVMTEFASAERYVNRSWSAAADGYIDEVGASLNRASRHLTKATELISAAEASHSQA